jgi:hypothetical protein
VNTYIYALICDGQATPDRVNEQPSHYLDAHTGHVEAATIVNAQIAGEFLAQIDATKALWESKQFRETRIHIHVPVAEQCLCRQICALTQNRR